MAAALTGTRLVSLIKGQMGAQPDKQVIRKALNPILPFLIDDLICDNAICENFRGTLSDEIGKLAFGLGRLTPEQRSRISIALINDDVGVDGLKRIAHEVWRETLPVPALLAAAKAATARGLNESGLSLLMAAVPGLNDMVSVAEAEGLCETVLAGGGHGVFSTKVRVALTGNCTCQPLAKIMPLALLSQGIDAEIWEAPFDSWASQLIDTDSELYQFKPSFVVLYLSSLGMSQAASRETDGYLNILEGAVERFLANSAASLVLILPEALEEELHGSSRLCAWRRKIREGMRSLSGPRVIILEPDQVLVKLGSARVFAPRLWYHAKLPMHPAALLELGKEASLTVANAVSQRVKVVACDLDNTLWGGVVGEDGPANLQLDVHGTGGPYIRLQAFLKELLGKGVILAAISKNNLSDVKEVFEKRNEMLLGLDDFTLVLANWEPKSQNLAAAAEKLNLGLKNFCFLDDSPFERAEVRAALPDVIVPELPVNPDEYVGVLVQTGLFHVPRITDEDKNRALMYKTEAVRSEAMNSSGSLEEFLSDLELKAQVLDIDASTMARANQLIHKTNQFNLTTRRHDASTLDRFSRDEAVFSYCYRVGDKFGDSGVTGLLIAVPSDKPETYEIDSWILSCRVMGRTVENALFSHLVSWLQERGIKKLRACYLPTAKNRPVAGLLPEIGFRLIDEAEDGVAWYEYDAVSGYGGNRFVKLIIDQPKFGLV